VIARSSQVVADVRFAIDALLDQHKDAFPSWVSVITGPSRTADIEKTLILGAHGPKKLIVFITK
jgi:L-lactate dehydrogenase complex protein LldG